MEFETDLMGSVAVGLDELYGGRDGIALRCLSVGETLSTDGSYVPIPTIDDARRCTVSGRLARRVLMNWYLVRCCSTQSRFGFGRFC